MFTGSGLVYSALPKLVHAHAKHILANPTPVRRGIELYPHQLIATKIVRRSIFSRFLDVEPYRSPWSRGLLRSLRYARIGLREPQRAGSHGMKAVRLTNGFKVYLGSLTKDGMSSKPEGLTPFITSLTQLPSEPPLLARRVNTSFQRGTTRTLVQNAFK